MKPKTMKKLIALTLAFSFALSGVMPALAAPITLGTSLQTGNGDSIAPIIKAKWEMKGAITFTGPANNSPVTNMTAFDGDLDDAESTPLTQLSPTGVWQTNVPYTVCAIVTDGHTNSDQNQYLAGVWVNEVHYPDDRAFHFGTVTDYNGLPIPADKQNGGPIGSLQDYGKSGCGALKNTSELRMQQLTLSDGIALFCDRVRNYGNNNLTEYYDNYTANEICGQELPQENAYVYCAPSSLYYEDPAGNYTVSVKAQNTSTSAPKDFGVNEMTYLELQAWDLDFTAIDYGPVGSLGLWYTDGGDKTFLDGDGAPTVRNLGNVRLYVGVNQDDMGFNPGAGDNNIHYRARVGHGVIPGWDDYKTYDPNWLSATVYLEDILDLSEDEKIDFGVKLDQWLNSNGTGQITLSHTDAEFRQCVTSSTPPR